MDWEKRFEKDFMEGRLDPFDFVLAEALGMTVGEMRERMSNQEYLQWRAFYTWRAAMQKLELEKVEAKSKMRGGLR